MAIVSLSHMLRNGIADDEYDFDIDMLLPEDDGLF
jgi:hypothetical protein